MASKSADSTAMAGILSWDSAVAAASGRTPGRTAGAAAAAATGTGAAASGSLATRVVVSDRWVSEAHRAYTYYVPAPQPYRLADAGAIDGSHVMVVPTHMAISHGVDPAGAISMDPAAKPLISLGVQTDPLVTGLKSDNKKLREAALAVARARREKERQERELAASSRFLANSSFTRLYHKPAFHSYGCVRAW